MLSLTRWQPDNEIVQNPQRTASAEPLFAELFRPFDALWREPFALLRQSGAHSATMQSVDISESDEAIHVTLDVPGYEGNDINVRVEGDTLHISGKLKKENDGKGHTLYRVERRQQSFERVFTLPAVVDTNKTEAICRNGVLSVTLPKREEAKPKTISVKVQS